MYTCHLEAVTGAANFALANGTFGLLIVELLVYTTSDPLIRTIVPVLST